MISFLLLFGLTLCAVGEGKICESLLKVGCYEKVGNTQHMNTLVYNGRNDIVWKDYTASLERILCKCKELASEQGFSLIGLQFYGECWGSKLSTANFLAQAKKSSKCINGNYKKCSKKDHELCSGDDISTAVFVEHINHGGQASPIDGDFSDWTNWSECSATCNKGFQERYRLCDNPKPQHGGKECEGDYEDIRSCTKQDCPASLTPHYCDMKQETQSTQLSTVVSFMTAPFCSVVYTKVANKKSKYSVSANIYSGQESTRIGIMYNVRDDKNFEFVYIHLNQPNSVCYTAGKVISGKTDWGSDSVGTCNRTFPASQWHYVEVKVTDKKIKLKVDHANVGSWDPKMSATGKGGVVLKNGWTQHHKEQGEFKDLTVA